MPCLQAPSLRLPFKAQTKAASDFADSGRGAVAMRLVAAKALRPRLLAGLLRGLCGRRAADRRGECCQAYQADVADRYSVRIIAHAQVPMIASAIDEPPAVSPVVDVLQSLPPEDVSSMSSSPMWWIG